MRLSTNSIYSMNMQSILQQQGRMASVGRQLASGKEMVTPSDDPRAASQALGVSQAAAVNNQFTAGRESARRSLSAEESELDQITRGLQAATPLLVQAGNGTLSDADRNSLATDLEGIRSQLLGSANAQDGNGRYLFAGHDVQTQPFVEDAAGQVSYAGDQGRQRLQVDASRQMPVNDTGTAVFESVTDSAQYVATAGGDNTGTGVFSGLNVADASASDYGDKFSVQFSGSGDSATYTVTNASTGDTVVSDQPFKAGQSIALGESMSITFKGAPAEGDNFVVARGREEDNNIINTLGSLIDRLKAGSETPAQKAGLDNAINSAHRKLGNSLDNVLTVRASLGARMNELDTLDMVGESRALNYESTHSELVDLDYVPAISEYSLAKVALQFSQQTFSDIQKLSMFNFG